MGSNLSGDYCELCGPVSDTHWFDSQLGSEEREDLGVDDAETCCMDPVLLKSSG